MKKSATIFLQAVLVIIGVASLALLLWEPRLESRNAHSTLFQVYFHDPFLAYAYTAAIPFFVALWKAFTILGLVRKNESFSTTTVQAFRTIKYCALITIMFILGAEGYFFIFQKGKDDIAGGVAMGLFLLFTSVITATCAALFEQLLQNAVDIQSENDLTV